MQHLLTPVISFCADSRPAVGLYGAAQHQAQQEVKQRGAEERLCVKAIIQPSPLRARHKMKNKTLFSLSVHELNSFAIL